MKSIKSTQALNVYTTPKEKPGANSQSLKVFCIKKANSEFYSYINFLIFKIKDLACRSGPEWPGIPSALGWQCGEYRDINE